MKLKKKKMPTVHEGYFFFSTLNQTVIQIKRIEMGEESEGKEMKLLKTSRRCRPLDVQ